MCYWRSLTTRASMKLLRTGFVTLSDALEPKWQSVAEIWRCSSLPVSMLNLYQLWNVLGSSGIILLKQDLEVRVAELAKGWGISRQHHKQEKKDSDDGPCENSQDKRQTDLRVLCGPSRNMLGVTWWLGFGIIRKYLHPYVWQLILLSPGVFSWITNWNIYKWPLHWPELPHSMVTSSYSLISVAGQCSKSVSANKVETALSYDLASGVTQHSFCYFLFIIETQACLDPKEGSIDYISWWMKYEGHMAKEHVGWEIRLQLKCNQQQALSSQKIFALFIFI